MPTKPTTTQIAATSTRTQADVNADSINVKNFGATGDGTTNDSSAVQAAITAAQAAGKDVYFPAGSYVISSLGNQSGRLFLHGGGNVTLKGTFTYSHASFPNTTPTATPITSTAPYFHASGINFQAVAGYGLQLLTNEQGGFISTFSLRDCKFFGPKGLLARHMIGFEVSNCEFNNTVAGARYESCTNGIHVACRWQNQAESGVWVTRASDQTLRFPGGENIKFSSCEWAVCTYGVVADQCAFMVLADCLLDYCAVPLFLSGAIYTKTSNTYYGASNVGLSIYASVSGYIAPVTSGVAVYGRPGGSPSGSRVFGFSAHNCEFVNYVDGSSSPIVTLDGYIDGTYPTSGETATIHDCLFYMQAVTTHSAGALLYINATQLVRVIGNRFMSLDKSTSMTDAYITSNCLDWINHSNSFYLCRESGVVQGSSYERAIGAIVQAGDPGAMGVGAMWVQP